MKRKRTTSYSNLTQFNPTGPYVNRKVKPRLTNFTRGGGGGGMYIKSSTVEKKYIDTAPAVYAADVTGSITLISGVATGTDYTNRIGRKILVNSIYVRGVVFTVGSNTNNSLARLMLVYDKQPTGALPVMTDILNSSTSVDQLNPNNRDRFAIIMDKQFGLGANVNAVYANTPNIFPIKKFKKCNLEIVFDGTTSGIASISTGAIYGVVIGNQTATTGPDFDISYRIRFTDL